MENVFVSDLFVQKKMSSRRAQEKKSLVGGSAAEGSGNAAAGIARSTTWSGVSFSTPNVSGSRVMAKKAVRMENERKTNASTERMEHGSTKQFLDSSSSSYVYPPMAGRAGGVTPLMFTNSSRRRSKSPLVARVQLSRVETK